MCDIGKIKHVTNEATPQKAQDLIHRVLVPAEKAFRPLVKVKVRRTSNEDRL